jgi:hypothetical protein
LLKHGADDNYYNDLVKIKVEEYLEHIREVLKVEIEAEMRAEIFDVDTLGELIRKNLQ